MAHRGNRSAREQFLSQMRKEWAELTYDWSLVVMAIEGGDYHCVDAPPQLRDLGTVLHAALQRGDAADDAIAETQDHDAPDASSASENETQAEHDFPSEYEAALQLRANVRPVTRFLVYAADSVFRGRWTIGEAYDVLGSDIARHYKIIRKLSHLHPSGDWFEQSTESNAFDQSDELFVFAYLLRAEQCWRGDTYGHFVTELSRGLRGEDGKAVDASLRRIYKIRPRRSARRRVLKVLRHGKNPRVPAVFQVPDSPIVDPEDVVLFQRRFEPLWTTNLRIASARARRGKVPASLIGMDADDESNLGV